MYHYYIRLGIKVMIKMRKETNLRNVIYTVSTNICSPSVTMDAQYVF